MRNLFDEEEMPGVVRLSEKYIVAPFSVLNTRGSEWQKRKRYWRNLGIKSELGREVGFLDQFKSLAYDNLKNKSGKNNGGFLDDPANKGSNSIFDPVLCELVYKWNKSKRVLDPFAGGSVRGIVASRCGCEYTGIDLREEQIQENEKQCEGLLPKPHYIIGDAIEELEKLEQGSYDTVFTCPPYFDMEQYSDDPRDLSNLRWSEFEEKLGTIIRKAETLLVGGGRMIIVIGNIRDKKGYYLDLCGTVKRAASEKLRLFNELIMVNHIGSKALAANRIFQSSNGKIISCHQNIFVFEKEAVATLRMCK